MSVLSSEDFGGSVCCNSPPGNLPAAEGQRGLLLSPPPWSTLGPPERTRENQVLLEDTSPEDEVNQEPVPAAAVRVRPARFKTSRIRPAVQCSSEEGQCFWISKRSKPVSDIYRISRCTDCSSSTLVAIFRGIAECQARIWWITRLSYHKSRSSRTGHQYSSGDQAIPCQEGKGKGAAIVSAKGGEEARQEEHEEKAGSYCSCSDQPGGTNDPCS
jgi:hypothetical protein